ncbi:MAG: hypothetical protein L0Z53_21515 [Acidobacteriales bacterium]|nr:hypothetical protein [Terriglobales bacterium]
MTAYLLAVCRGEVLTPEKCQFYRDALAKLATGERPQPNERPRAPFRLTDSETKQLFPSIDDPTLLGNRIEQLTKAIGIPSCGGCGVRKRWLNKAHAWIREQFTAA